MHHLIPDAVAQEHRLVQEALRRVERYTIDRGSNLIDLPSSIEQAKGKIIHRGNHPEYNNYVAQKLDAAVYELRQISKKSLQTIDSNFLEQALMKVENEVRKQIEKNELPSSVLRELVGDGFLPGKKLSMSDYTHEKAIA